MKKTSFFLLLIFALPILLTACKGAPEPLTQERLDALNCQTGDLPKKQTYRAVDPRAIYPNAFPEGDPILTSALAWNETSTNRQTFSCSLFVFPDELTAQKNIQYACNTLRPPIKYPNLGDFACQDGQQEVNLVFQKDVYIIWLWADYEGKGVTEVAKILDRRLTPKP